MASRPGTRYPPGTQLPVHSPGALEADTVTTIRVEAAEFRQVHARRHSRTYEATSVIAKPTQPRAQRSSSEWPFAPPQRQVGRPVQVYRPSVQPEGRVGKLHA